MIALLALFLGAEPQTVEVHVLERRALVEVAVRGGPCEARSIGPAYFWGAARHQRARPAAAQGLVLADLRLLRLRRERVHACSQQGPCLVAEALEVVCRAPLVLQGADLPARRYGHFLQVATAGGTLRFKVRLSLDAYVAGVLAQELEAGPPEAKKALAIVIRTFAYGSAGAPRHPDGALCDQTHCQLFAGVPRAFDRAPKLLGPMPSSDPATATHGQVLVGQDGTYRAFYHGTCGGRTLAADAVWPAFPAPDLVGILDLDSDGQPWCQRGLEARWTTTVPARALAAVLSVVTGRKLDPGSLEIAAIQADGSRFRIADQDGVGSYPLYQVYPRLLANLGASRLRSNRFDITRQGDGFHFAGRGVGHGIGLCLAGAVARAEVGQWAEDILHVYFPRLRLTLLPEPSAAPWVPVPPLRK